MEYYLTIKKNEIMPLVTISMIGIIILSEKCQRKTNIYISYTWNLKKMIHMNLFKKQKQTSKSNLWLPKGKGVYI